MEGRTWHPPCVLCPAEFIGHCLWSFQRKVIHVNAAKTPADVLKLMKDKNIKAVDLRFMDFPGMQQHFTVPAHCIDQDAFKDGLGFDGSSIRGWQAINE